MRSDSSWFSLYGDSCLKLQSNPAQACRTVSRINVLGVVSCSVRFVSFLFHRFRSEFYSLPVCRCESRPLVGKRPLVNVQPKIPVLHARVAGYFSQAVWWEKMASMSAKLTQFSFPLRCSFPTVFIATMYGLKYSSHFSANQGLYLAIFPRC